MPASCHIAMSVSYLLLCLLRAVNNAAALRCVSAVFGTSHVLRRGLVLQDCFAVRRHVVAGAAMTHPVAAQLKV